MLSKQELVNLIDADSAKHLQFLQALIRTPSPNPPGDTRAAIAAVEEYLAGHDINATIIAPCASAPNLVTAFQSSPSVPFPGRSIILNGHIDQFPVADADQWKRDPYSGDVEDGFIHGRSGVDMKVGTAASIIAFTYLHKFRAQLEGRCVLEVVSDEETGGRWGTRHLLEFDERSEEWKGDCVLIGEPSGVESIRFGEKGTLRLTFKVATQGAHGAYIHRSEGAIRIAARLINRLVALEGNPGAGMDEVVKKYMQRPDVRKVADDIMSVGAADAMLKPTVNIGTIQGGAKINMIPSDCQFEADIRVPIGIRNTSIQEQINRILEDFPQVQYVIHENHSHESTHSSHDHEIVEILQRNAEFIAGRKPLAICSLGATDCKHFRNNGVPAYAHGPSPQGMAERDEKASIEEFQYLVKANVLTVWEYLGGIDQ